MEIQQVLITIPILNPQDYQIIADNSVKIIEVIANASETSVLTVVSTDNLGRLREYGLRPGIIDNNYLESNYIYLLKDSSTDISSISTYGEIIPLSDYQYLLKTTSQAAFSPPPGFTLAQQTNQTTSPLPQSAQVKSNSDSLLLIAVVAVISIITIIIIKYKKIHK